MGGRSMARWGIRHLIATLVVAALAASLPGTDGRPARAAFPGGNGLLTFMEDSHIFGLDIETGMTVEIASAWGADWSPDGTRLLLAGVPGSEFEVVVAAADGTGQVNLTEDREGLATRPSWSADGSAIVYLAGVNTTALGLMAADGSEDRRLDLAGMLEILRVEAPDWSPLGDRIAFTGTWGGPEIHPTDVFTVAPDGSGLTQLTRQTDFTEKVGPSFDPEWSPDGTMIAFSRWSSAAYLPQIWVMNADGSDQRPLLEDQTSLENPVWSPDGTMIAFNVGNGDLVRTTNADGTGVRDVMDSEGDRLFVLDWQPLPQ